MVAMIGAIVLTHRDRRRPGGRTSPGRTRAASADTLEIVDVSVRRRHAASSASAGREPELVTADEPHEHGVGKPGPGEH